MSAPHCSQCFAWTLSKAALSTSQMSCSPTLFRFVRSCHLDIECGLRNKIIRISIVPRLSIRNPEPLCFSSQTVDTYYRKSSCAPYVTSVRAPLLAMSALDDPICTRETIPWDECRLNPNVVLATAARGGHLAVYEGWLPTRLWWTKPCEEFLGAIFKEGI